jgi:hypothetical protein
MFYIMESVVGFCDFVVFPRTNWSILYFVYIYIVTYSRYAWHPLPYASGDVTSTASATVTGQSTLRPPPTSGDVRSTAAAMVTGQSTLRPPPASGDVTSASHCDVTHDNAVD